MYSDSRGHLQTLVHASVTSLSGLESDTIGLQWDVEYVSMDK